MARGYFQMGNQAIEDTRLYYSTRHVYAAMLAYRSKAGTVCKSLERLAALAHCSVSTVRQAVDQLMEHGYLRRHPADPVQPFPGPDGQRHIPLPDRSGQAHGGRLHPDPPEPAGAEGDAWDLRDPGCTSTVWQAGRDGPTALCAMWPARLDMAKATVCPGHGGAAPDESDGTALLPEG